MVHCKSIELSADGDGIREYSKIPLRIVLRLVNINWDGFGLVRMGWYTRGKVFLSCIVCGVYIPLVDSYRVYFVHRGTYSVVVSFSFFFCTYLQILTPTEEILGEL